MFLSNLKPQKGKIRSSKRVGRGYGSGKGGHTVGYGTKGQKARGTGKVNPGFEGGQVPLYKRLPQIGGFTNSQKKDIGIVSLDFFNRFKAESKITPENLIEEGLFKVLPKYGVKILANGELTKKITISGFLCSEEAKKKIEKSGSKLVL